MTGPFNPGAARREQLNDQKRGIDRLAAELVAQPHPLRRDTWFLPRDLELLTRAVIAAWPRSGPGSQAPSWSQVHRRLSRLVADGQLGGRYLPSDGDQR